MALVSRWLLPPTVRVVLRRTALGRQLAYTINWLLEQSCETNCPTSHVRGQSVPFLSV